MTHFAHLVLVAPYGVPNRLLTEGEVARLMWPFVEGDEWGEDGTRFDWYVIGGRFTGLLDDYDPDADPRNYEPCGYCVDGITDQATAAKYPAYADSVGKPCIQCNVGHGGKVKQRPEGVPLGYRRSWFNFERPDGDIVTASDIDVDALEYLPGSVLTPDGVWHEASRIGLFMSELPKENGEPNLTKDEWKERFRALLAAHPHAQAVLVDCHV